MQNVKINHAIVKNIGYINHTDKFVESIKEKKFSLKSFAEETYYFLNKSYHKEYLNIMFPRGNKDGISRYVKKLSYEIEICNIKTKVLLNNIELFLFNDSFRSEQIGMFSLDYLKENSSLDDVSNISFSLKSHDCEIIYEQEKMTIKSFIYKVLFGIDLLENNSLHQYAGNKFKQFIVIDFEHDKYNRDNLLFELGTSSKIGSVDGNTIESPSDSYLKKILGNKISCFKNYDCLALLNSFIVIGANNYDRNNDHAHSSWNDIYFSLYIYNLYLKSVLQVLSNDFSINSMKKRYEFQKFHDKYYYKKISFNFLPNEIYKGIVKSIEVDEDFDHVQGKLETLAVRVNERQQSLLGNLLACISVIALLETPLHIEAIRKIIGVENLITYNAIMYCLLVSVVFIFLAFKALKKY